MPKNITQCPFSHLGCKNCPVYRGRHNYIVTEEGESKPRSRVLRNVQAEWEERFEEVILNLRGSTYTPKKSPKKRTKGLPQETTGCEAGHADEHTNL